MSFYRTDKHTATCWFQITNIFYSRIISNIKYLVIYWNINFICYWIVPRNYKLFRTLENKIYIFILNPISHRTSGLFNINLSWNSSNNPLIAHPFSSSPNLKILIYPYLTQSPRSAMAQDRSLFTRIFLDFRSRWAIPGFPCNIATF